MKIKFIEILPKTGDYFTALFEVEDKKVKIGITDSLRQIWEISPQNGITLALKQIGRLKILLMITKKETIKDYIFQTYDFKKGDRTMTFGEVVDKLEKEISESD